MAKRSKTAREIELEAEVLRLKAYQRAFWNLWKKDPKKIQSGTVHVWFLGQGTPSPVVATADATMVFWLEDYCRMNQESADPYVREVVRLLRKVEQSA